MKTYVVKVSDDVSSDVIDVIKALIVDEEEAIAAYQVAIKKLPQFEKQLKHILDEEIEHKRELEQLLK